MKNPILRRMTVSIASFCAFVWSIPACLFLRYFTQHSSKLFAFRLCPGVVNTGWGLVAFIAEGSIPISLLNAKLKTSTGLQDSRLMDTPHYDYAVSFLSGKYLNDNYIDYLKDNFPENIPEEKISRFQSVIVKLSSQKSSNEPILVKLSVFPLFKAQIVDGLHRATAALAIGETAVQCRFTIGWR